MMRKVVESNGAGGLVERWVPVLGEHRARPLLGHDRPTFSIATPVGGAGNVSLGDGLRQRPLGRAA